MIGLIGAGGCGSVCSAEEASGELVAVKYFEGMSISRSLLSAAYGKLQAGDWPDGVMPVKLEEFADRPVMVVMPMVADPDGEDEWLPRSLQHRWPEHQGEGAWPLIGKIAKALASLHERGVVHGNLKPGNVFFDATGGVLLSDWALGNMPGVSRFEFTDAVLYQPPEQLRDAGGYLGDAGCRWDVFAFGVLAYRLLTGAFPRCDATFAKVAPPVGETRREGVHADLAKVARNLEAQPDVSWPDEAVDTEEKERREWIGRCLHLDPSLRPVSMQPVAAGLFPGAAEVDAQPAVAGDPPPPVEGTGPGTSGKEEELSFEREKGEEKSSRGLSGWFYIATGAVAGAVVMGGLWQMTVAQLRDEKRRAEELAGPLEAKAASAMVSQAIAEKAAAEAKVTLEYEKSLGLARLGASRWVGDRLFAWAMEKGNRKLPPLDGRELRLKHLEGYFVEFLEKTKAVEGLADERARAKLQLAEISFSMGDSEKAVPRWEEAVEAAKSLPMDAELSFRMAKNRLLLALLLQQNKDQREGAAFEEARAALAAVPQSEVDSGWLEQLLAILDFHEAKLLSAKGESAKALEQLMRATQTLNRLAQQRPDVVVLRSELAACYLSSATILEGMGNLGDARETQLLAVAEITRLLEKNPGDPALRLDLAACHASLADSAMLSADTNEADARSAASLKLLEELLNERPDHAEAVSLMAGQIGLRAGLMRDRGEGDSAVDAFDTAIRMLEGASASAPDDALIRYRLALVLWQKGRMMGMAGRRPEEIELIRRSYDLLGKLESAQHSGGPPMEKIQSTSGYVLGDLGHALQLAGRKDDAKNAFAESVGFWERLLESRPQSEEYQEGLAWCRLRIKELE